MSRYVIGDVQGCFDALMALLDKLDFAPRNDRLYFTGDLVNRGGQSVHVLRWVVAHQSVCQSVLGNHDLSILHRWHCPGQRTISAEIQALFDAPDADLLLDWLAARPLLHEIENLVAAHPWWLCHAGIYPLWEEQQARREAEFVVDCLRHRRDWFFDNLFGNRPGKPVQSGTTGTDTVARMRFAVNAFTRMRFLHEDGCLDFVAKGPPEKFPDLCPWFRFSQRMALPATVLYGHWSALGLHQENRTICLDTGKVWGGKLTAMRLPEKRQEKPVFIAV